MIDLSLAQSILLYDFYQENLFSKLPPMREDDLRYPAQYYGADNIRHSIARFLKESWGCHNIGYQDVFAVAGAAAGLECLAFSLREPPGPGGKYGSVILPAPCWDGFQYAFQQRSNMLLCPFDLKREFELTLADVQRAYRTRLETDGRAPAILILTNPQNPLAVNYEPSLLEEIYDWALKETQMHIVSDEMYTHCQVAAPDAGPPFRSALSLDAVRRHPGEATNRVHVVWGLSKDFGLAGFKIGFVISRSWAVRSQMGCPSNVYHSMTSFCPFDMLKTYEVSPLFLRGDVPDPSLAHEAMTVMVRRLTERHDAVVRQLRENDIPFVGKSNSALFFWLDLRKYLGKLPIPNPNTPVYLYIDPIESTLNNQILQYGNVKLLPGGVLSAPQPGYFRLCYTGWDAGVVTEGINGLAKALKSLH